MTFQCSSTNYVWTEKGRLGAGACGTVYRAWHKETGDVVAVKTFSQSAQYLRIPRDVRMREFDILSRLNHNNIVRLLASETQSGRFASPVLVMEICAGGSLLDVLDQPINACGLDEEEFLLVLRHLTAGLKHLRDQDIVHRDIKPGNIMRALTKSGRSIYKLADFGAARHLTPTATFTSICGTEEYLNPGLYGHVVLQQSLDEGGGFDATTDLWSVGVTLYQAATGQLPFRSYEGRNSKLGQETMYKIMTTKDSGVISGVQTSANGSIDFSSELPAQCRLSAGLRQHMTPLLAGLLEGDPTRASDYLDYFENTRRLIEKVVLHVFDSHHVTLLRVYIDSSAESKQLQQLITDQTGMSAERQLLLFNGQPVLPTNQNEGFDLSTLCTSDTNPIYLFRSQPIDQELNSINRNHIIPSLPVAPSATTADADYVYCTSCCEVVRYIEHTLVALVHSTSLLHSSAKSYHTDLLHSTVTPLRCDVDKYRLATEEAGTRLHLFIENESMEQCDRLDVNNMTSSCIDIYSQLTEELESISVRSKELVVRLRSSRDTATLLFDQTPHQLRDDEDDHVETLHELVKYLEETREEWKQDRSHNSRHLPEDRQLSHRYDRNKLNVVCNQALSMLKDWCLPTVANMTRQFNRWFTDLERLQETACTLRAELDVTISKKASFLTSLDQLFLCHHHHKSEQQATTTTTKNTTTSSCSRTTNGPVANTPAVGVGTQLPHRAQPNNNNPTTSDTRSTANNSRPATGPQISNHPPTTTTTSRTGLITPSTNVGKSTSSAGTTDYGSSSSGIPGGSSGTSNSGRTTGTSNPGMRTGHAAVSSSGYGSSAITAQGSLSSTSSSSSTSSADPSHQTPFTSSPPNNLDYYKTVEEEGFLLVTSGSGSSEEIGKDCRDFLHRNGKHNDRKIEGLKILVEQQGELLQRWLNKS